MYITDNKIVKKKPTMFHQRKTLFQLIKMCKRQPLLENLQQD